MSGDPLAPLEDLFIQDDPAADPGADGEFVLYEDEGDGYNYEKGAYTTISIKWNDRTQTLTIGERQGQYKDMLQQRRFTVVTPDGKQQAVEYTGKIQSVKL